MKRISLLLMCVFMLPTSSTAQAYAPLLFATDDFPEGDDEMPEGDDKMPEGDDPGERQTAKPQKANDDEMPMGDENEESASPEPTLVAVPAAPKCSLPPRSEGYLQAHLERPRSLDLHGLDAQVNVIEGQDACLAEVEVTIPLAIGCSLAMRFRQQQGRNFDVVSFRLDANECAELNGVEPGRYLLHQGNALLVLSGEPAGDCMPQGLARISGSLVVKQGNSELPIDLDGLRLSGDFKVLIDEALSCRRKRRAAPIQLSSDRRRPTKSSIIPWVAGGSAVLAGAAAITWYLLESQPEYGSLTLQIR
jgi:hypothetical protein